MNIPQSDTAIEHRCEALTISEIPHYRCTTSATGARQGPEICTSHARSLHVHGSTMTRSLCLISMADVPASRPHVHRFAEVTSAACRR
jgi:hypothetical protein